MFTVLSARSASTTARGERRKVGRFGDRKQVRAPSARILSTLPPAARVSQTSVKSSPRYASQIVHPEIFSSTSWFARFLPARRSSTVE